LGNPADSIDGGLQDTIENGLAEISQVVEAYLAQIFVTEFMNEPARVVACLVDPGATEDDIWSCFLMNEGLADLKLDILLLSKDGRLAPQVRQLATRLK